MTCSCTFRLKAEATVLRHSLTGYFVERIGNEYGNRARAKIPPRSAADRDGPFRCLPVAGYQHVRDLLKLRLPDLIANLLLPVVELHAQPGGGELVADAGGVDEVTVGNRQHNGLNRSQPQRPGTGVMLDQQADEALERAENRAVDHDRPMFRVVRPDVLEVEPLRHLVIEL